MRELSPIGYLFGKPIYFPTLEQMKDSAFLVNSFAEFSKEQRKLIQNYHEVTGLKLNHTFKELLEFYFKKWIDRFRAGGR